MRTRARLIACQRATNIVRLHDAPTDLRPRKSSFTTRALERSALCARVCGRKPSYCQLMTIRGRTQAPRAPLSRSSSWRSYIAERLSARPAPLFVHPSALFVGAKWRECPDAPGTATGAPRAPVQSLLVLGQHLIVVTWAFPARGTFADSGDARMEGALFVPGMAKAEQTNIRLPRAFVGRHFLSDFFSTKSTLMFHRLAPSQLT